MHEAMSEGQAIKRLPFIFAYQYEKKEAARIAFQGNSAVWRAEPEIAAARGKASIFSFENI